MPYIHQVQFFGRLDLPRKVVSGCLQNVVVLVVGGVDI